MSSGCHSRSLLGPRESRRPVLRACAIGGRQQPVQPLGGWALQAASQSTAAGGPRGAAWR